MKDDFEKKVHFRAWGKPDTYERLRTINLMLDFIRRAEALADQHDGLSEEVYSAATISMLKMLVPNDYKKEINIYIPMSCLKKEKISRIQSILEAQKEATLNGIPDKSNYTPKKSDAETAKAQFGKSKGKPSQDKGGHNCSNSTVCNTKWDKLGCIELYKLTTVDERKNI